MSLWTPEIREQSLVDVGEVNVQRCLRRFAFLAETAAATFGRNRRAGSLRLTCEIQARTLNYKTGALGSAQGRHMPPQAHDMRREEAKGRS